MKVPRPRGYVRSDGRSDGRLVGRTDRWSVQTDGRTPLVYVYGSDGLGGGSGGLGVFGTLFQAN